MIGKHATKVTRGDNGDVLVVYHSTVVVRVKRDKTVTLNSGGWQTTTTKRRMNQVAQEFELGYYVFQRDFVWYVETRNHGTLDYYDGMEFKP